MDTVTLSPKFQVVIPRRVRERMKLRPGERFEVISFDDRIELIPIRPMSLQMIRKLQRGLGIPAVVLIRPYPLNVSNRRASC